MLRFCRKNFCLYQINDYNVQGFQNSVKWCGLGGMGNFAGGRFFNGWWGSDEK